MGYPESKASSQNPRQLALDGLCKIPQTPKSVFPASALPEDSRDRALFNELIQGVLRHREFLDWIIFRYAKTHRNTIPRTTLNALRLGVFQLVFLERIPSFAAIHETVELVKERAGKKAAQFSNAVLRRVQREGVPDLSRLSGSPLERIRIETSHPKWMVRRWIQRWGPEKAKHLCLSNNQIPPMTLRVNSLKGDRQKLIRDLEAEGIRAEPSPLTASALTVKGKFQPLGLRSFQRGRYYIQDEGAQWIAPLLSPKPGDRILDACAAPGGKTTHLAELMENRGSIVACDRAPQRLGLLQQNLKRLEIRIIKPYLWDAARKFNALNESDFDGAIVDAPCSGLGVLRRHPEGKWNKNESLIRAYAVEQTTLLEQVSPLIKPGGVLIYSTCSTEPEENEMTIARFLKNHAHYRLEEALPPDHTGAQWFRTPEGNFSTLFNAWNMDCFFAAKLRRLA